MSIKNQKSQMPCTNANQWYYLHTCTCFISIRVMTVSFKKDRQFATLLQENTSAFVMQQTKKRCRRKKNKKMKKKHKKKHIVNKGKTSTKKHLGSTSAGMTTQNPIWRFYKCLFNSKTHVFEKEGQRKVSQQLIPLKI